MGLLEDLQGVHTQIMGIFNPMQGPIVFRQSTRVKDGQVAGPYKALGQTDVEIPVGSANVKFASAYAQREGSFIKAGDLQIELAGNLIAEENIKSARVYYPFDGDFNQKPYSVVAYRPKTLPGGGAILDGGVVVWEIVARQEK